MARDDTACTMRCDRYPDRPVDGRTDRCDWDEEACSSAAGGGHLFVLQWLRYHG